MQHRSRHPPRSYCLSYYFSQVLQSPIQCGVVDVISRRPPLPLGFFLNSINFVLPSKLFLSLPFVFEGSLLTPPWRRWSEVLRTLVSVDFVLEWRRQTRDAGKKFSRGQGSTSFCVLHVRPIRCHQSISISMGKTKTSQGRSIPLSK
jgi:hypothetical protein